MKLVIHNSEDDSEKELLLYLFFSTKNMKITALSSSKWCGDTSVHKPSPVKLPPKYQELNSSTDIDVHQIEHSTREQANSQEWFNSRKCRLTASNFDKVLKRKAIPSKKFLNSIFGGKKCFSAPSLNYGKRNEGNVKPST